MGNVIEFKRLKGERNQKDKMPKRGVLLWFKKTALSLKNNLFTYSKSCCCICLFLAISVAVRGNFSAGISSLLCDMAEADVGLAMVPEIEARVALASGRLVRVLPQLEPEPLGIYGLYQSRDHQHAALGLFLDAIKGHLG